MDIVITYVDGNDPVWKQDYEKFTNVPVMQKRFRDWGTLRYLLRGVQKNMPFIRNVYLVVSHPSQVPQWADQENLKVVLHKDIIPQEFLPTFNSTTIEMFLHRIEGLDEEFIYFNDDIFPVKPLAADDFFKDGKAVTGMSKHVFAGSMYKGHVRKSDVLARRALGLSKSMVFVRPQHASIPVLKSESHKVYDSQKSAVQESLTRVRTEGNVNMTLFLSYMYHQGLVVNKRQSCRHISLAATTPEKLYANIMTPDRKLLCINDVKLSDKRYEEFRNVMIEAFEACFPIKSRFEK